jgi:hypothetical protein
MVHPEARETIMRSWLRKPASCALAALLAAPMLLAGCKTQNNSTTINNQPDDYRQWEHDTNRPHQDLDKRTPDEQREYQDWQQSHHH